jgi:RNA polymerase sigma factor (sigma-70 family)
MDDALTITTAMTAARNQTLTQSIKAYSSRLLGFIKKRISNNEDAEDILQEVFYQLAGNTQPIEQLTGWLFAVARNKITDRYRRQALPLIDDLQPAGADEEDSFNWKDLLASSGDSPETTYLRNLFWEELQLALDELPAEQSRVFIQHEMEGVSFKEISQASGVSVATLLSQKRYAVLFLRERLQGLKDELMDY